MSVGRASGKLHIDATLHYRKIDQFLLNYVMGEKSGLTAPVVDIAERNGYCLCGTQRELQHHAGSRFSRNVVRTGSRRLRRVAWTASTFVVLVLIGALVTWRIRKENAPEEYTPGEASKDITSALSDRPRSWRKARFKPSRTP